MSLWRHWSAMLVHDLRSPTLAAAGYVRLLRDGGVSPALSQDKCLTEAARCLERTGAFLDAVSTIYRKDLRLLVEQLAAFHEATVDVDVAEEGITELNESVLLAVWMMVMSELSATAEEGRSSTAYVRAGATPDGWRIVVAPSRSCNWKSWSDVTEQMSNGDSWIAAAVTELQVSGHHVAIHSSGRDAAMVIAQ